ncbi:MAG: LysM peptidoglycan-binding domain-containing protein [Treponema sp.]|nr:LysM peptidoglycan-binding domain-containing protein [Treponema sp.]
MEKSTGKMKKSGAAPVQNCFRILAMTAFLLSAAGILAANERPLRSAVPDPSLPVAVRTSTFLFEPAENSLLTERALEQPLTQHYIAHYTSPYGIATLNAILERGNIYLPFIRNEVKQRGLPPELVYLPIIESGFLITARSRSGAMGLWQFMLNSISPYNMRVTDYIDERRDFLKSTRGALQKLEDEHRRLGCWELTLAAYNSGFNAVTRTIQSTGNRDYWELSARNELRPETLHFVPKLIAVSYVVSQPRRFGINVWHDKFEWIDIPLRRQVSIDVVADEAGVDRNLMRRLNAELLHGISPLDSNYRLKIPLAHHDKIIEVLERDDLKLIRYHYHLVSQGDTLWGISRQYGTPLHVIEQHNPGISGRYLKIGETIAFPSSGVSSAAPVVRQAAPSTNGTHIVQRGETFWSLSRMYGVPAQALADANEMQLDQILHEGRTLRVPIID